MPPEEGYRRARELLHERFGNKFTISQSWVTKVTDGPPIKASQAEAMQDMADDLRGCVETLKAMNVLGEIDSRIRMQKIVGRLPSYLQTSWRKEAVGRMERTGTYPDIEALASFVEKAAREANDPVFGIMDGYQGSQKHEKHEPESRPKKRGASFNVQTGSKPERPPTKETPRQIKMSCHHCGDDHKMSTCTKWKALPPKERLEVVRQNRLCFNCVDWKNHPARWCKKPRDCNVEGCNRKHATALHEALEEEYKEKKPDQLSSRETTTGSEVSSYACLDHVDETSIIALPIVKVKVKVPGQSHYTHTLALLDPGSNKTFCSKGLVEALGATGRSTSLMMRTLMNQNKVDTVELALEVSAVASSGRKKSSVNIPKVLAIPNFPPFDASVPPNSAIQAWNHLKDIKFPLLMDDTSSQVSLLIGQDAPDALLPIEVRQGKSGQPYAMRTRLGWTLNGPFPAASQAKEADSLCNYVDVNEERDDACLLANVENFWKLDTEYALASTEAEMSVEDRAVVDIWNRTIKQVDGHYQMSIPFRQHDMSMPDNKKMAEARLRQLKVKLSKNPEMLERYTENMKDLIAKGHAELVQEPTQDDNVRVWYLPHHGVINQNKPEKLRIVFDCAARYAGTSLNANVMQGPDLMNTLVGVLLRFREGPVAVMADVEAMFHQVKVTPSDRDVLRFLWWENGELDGNLKTYRMTVHLFGGVWCPSCAQFALRRTALDSTQEYDQMTLTTVRECFYVDDCLKSFTNEEDARRLVRELTELLSHGGFRLTKWISNRREVLSCVDKSEQVKEVRSLDLSQSNIPQQRALGVSWDPEEDCLSVNVNLVLKQQTGKFTRRGLLSIMSTVYDPLGFVGPFVLQAKFIFQSECKMEKGWDDELHEENKKMWAAWLEQLVHLQDVRLSRSLVPSAQQPSHAELHHFCDASQQAYGTVTYMRMSFGDSEVHCTFVLAKTKLAPLKQMTIPRLELSAAVLGVKVNSMLMRELRTNITRCVFWTDSLIVLQYIRNRTRRFQTFVANRVALIHDGSSPDQWRFVDGELNPADDASRGLTAEQLVASMRWRHGPGFLWKDEGMWPKTPTVPDTLEQDKEVKKEATSCNIVAAGRGATDQLLEYHSSWFKLKKAVAWIRRFVDWLRAKRLGEKPDKGRLQVEELRSAEKKIVHYVQHQHYDAELKALEKKGTIPHSSSVYSLEPYKGDGGLLRVGGRLTKATSLDEDRKHPALLPRKAHVTKLIVREAHETSSHSGREYVLSLVRKKYWIPKPRSVLDVVLRGCVPCRKLYAQPVQQRMADLIDDRVSPSKPPFSYVGVDCFGPFQVKRGRSVEKRYGCMFTCLTMRAVHIEKLNSLDTSSFMNALVRFIARRGVPDKIRSDNGTNFVGANKELRNAVKQLHNVCLQREIEWEFNPPAASNMGGAWERQIRSARKILAAMLTEHSLDDEKLETLFSEVEAIINGRPLTPLSADPNDLGALTPNHLLLLRGGPEGPPGEFKREDTYGRRWRHIQHLADVFWRRWVDEYLPSIMTRQKWVQPRKNLAPGDLVLIADTGTPRKSWPLGRITKVKIGQDGLARSAEVKTVQGTYVRPTNKICVVLNHC